MGFSLIGTRVKAATGAGTTAVTTDALDATGATILVACVAWYNPGSITTTVTDSLGNTWTPLTQISASSGRLQLWYCLNPTVGASQTVTATWSTSGAYGVLSLVAYGGATAYHQGQVNASSLAGITSLAAGSVTPDKPGSLIVSSVALLGSSPQGATATNDAGLTSFGANFVGGTNIGATTAHGLVSSSTTVTHSWTNSSVPTIAQAVVFPPSGTILPRILHHRRMQGAA